MRPLPAISPRTVTNLGAERAAHCYIVHYARADISAFRRTCLADWVRMARRFVLERGDKVREQLAFGILILLLICLFAFTFAVLGKGEYEPTGENPQQISRAWPDPQPGPEASRARCDPIGRHPGVARQ